MLEPDPKRIELSSMSSSGQMGESFSAQYTQEDRTKGAQLPGSEAGINAITYIQARPWIARFAHAVRERLENKLRKLSEDYERQIKEKDEELKAQKEIHARRIAEQGILLRKCYERIVHQDEALKQGRLSRNKINQHLHPISRGVLVDEARKVIMSWFPEMRLSSGPNTSWKEFIDALTSVTRTTNIQMLVDVVEKRQHQATRPLPNDREIRVELIDISNGSDNHAWVIPLCKKPLSSQALMEVLQDTPGSISQYRNYVVHHVDLENIREAILESKYPGHTCLQCAYLKEMYSFTFD